MLSTGILVCMLLPVLAGGSTAQQDLLCTDSYSEFESASVGSSVNGSNIRNQLYRAFYAPNKHLPYSVLVTYQLVLPNGTRFNLSSDQDCRTELWVWLSSPVFLETDSTFINRLLLFTLNYFMEWDPPHVTITMTTAPCPDKIGEFLSGMTASLKDYALGQIESKTNLGYIKRGCGKSANIHFSEAGKAPVLIATVYIIILSGFIFQIVFVWIVSAVLLKITFKEYAQETFTYSYDMYGMFWGISTTAMGLLGAFHGIVVNIVYTQIAYRKDTIYPMLGGLLTIMVVELPVAIYTARKATVAVPCMFKYPATLLCCGRQRQAERFVTTIALWVDLVALQLILFEGSVVVFVISAAPFAIVTNVMLLVLALSCFANIFALLFTIFAHICSPSDQQSRLPSCSLVLRAVVVLPLLLMIMCYGVVAAAMGSVINMDAKDNTLSFINSIATPILLGVVSIFLKRFISAWLKWSPQGTEHETDNSHRQEAYEELLDP